MQLFHLIKSYLLANPLLIASLITGFITIVVAGTTLLGVKITLKAAAERSTLELAHAAQQAASEREYSRSQAAEERANSAKEAEKDRLATLRRTVYLDALEEMHKLQRHLGSREIEKILEIDQNAVFSKIGVFVSRMSVVGNQETALMAREIATVYIESLAKVLKIMEPQSLLKENARRAKEILDAAIVDTEKIRLDVPDFDESNIEELNDRLSKLELLQKSYDIQMIKLKNYKEAEIEAGLVQIEYARFLVADYVKINEMIDDLVCAVRQELEIPTDREMFWQQTEVGRESLQKAAEELEVAYAEFSTQQPS